MKLTSIELHPDGSSQVIELDFRDPSASKPYNIKGVAGLDAEEISKQFYAKASGSVKPYYNLLPNKREIVILAGLNPNFTENEGYSDLRDNLYRAISSSRTGLIEIQLINNGDVVASISGSASKVEAPQFEKTQQIRITIVCETETLFKAPERELITTGEINMSDIVLNDPKSTAPHGFIFELAIQAPMDYISISDPDSEWSFRIDPRSGFQTGFLHGDTLFFSSEQNNRYLYMSRIGYASPFQLADVIRPGSVWPIMFPGETHLEINNPDDMYFYFVRYYPTYWGV